MSLQVVFVLCLASDLTAVQTAFGVAVLSTRVKTMLESALPPINPRFGRVQWIPSVELA